MFKDKLKELRKQKGLSQQELADKIYVSRSAICKWEMGNGIPSDINLSAICSFFEVDEEWLFDRNDLKEGIKIVKRNRSVNISNIILIILSSVFLVLILMMLSSTNSIVNIKEPINLGRLFNLYELIIILSGVFLSLSIGCLLILNNNGFLTLNIDDIKRKKILNFGYIISCMLFILFIAFSSIRLSHTNHYYKVISSEMILQDLILTMFILIVVIAYILQSKKLRIFEIVLSIITALFFSHAVFFFGYSFIHSLNNNISAVLIGMLLNGIFGFITVVFGIISIIMGLNVKPKNKTLFVVNFLIILITIIMFILIICLFL